jgi:hypothetical protein
VDWAAVDGSRVVRPAVPPHQHQNDEGTAPSTAKRYVTKKTVLTATARRRAEYRVSGPYYGLHGHMRQRDPVPDANLFSNAAQAHAARPQVADGGDGVHQGAANRFDDAADLRLLEFAEAIGRAPAGPVPEGRRPAP